MRIIKVLLAPLTAVLIVFSALGVPMEPVHADELEIGAFITKCAGCHAMQKPDKASVSLEGRLQRKGPPLYYAGNKYRGDWLREWLQKPTRIHPGGMFAGNHTVVTDDGDIIDESTLKPHIALIEAEAKMVADYLMKLEPYNNKLKPGEYTPSTVSRVFGGKDFNKFKGCGACHRDSSDHGGVSGPELYTSFIRLQPEFIVSYIRNPIQWEPFSLMPNKHLNDPAIYKLVNYLKLISEEGEK